MPVEHKLPKGLHMFFKSDKFTDGVFWFMAGMIYGCGKNQRDAAIAFREFLQLDEDAAPTHMLQQKFRRQLNLFKRAVSGGKSEIAILQDDLIEEVKNAVLRELENKDRRAHLPGRTLHP